MTLAFSCVSLCLWVMGSQHRARKQSAGCFEWDGTSASFKRPNLVAERSLRNFHPISGCLLPLVGDRIPYGFSSKVDGPLVAAMIEGSWVLLSHAEQVRLESSCTVFPPLRYNVKSVNDADPIEMVW